MNEEFFVCLKFSFPGFFELEKFYMGALFKEGIALKCGCRVPRAFAGRALSSRQERMIAHSLLFQTKRWW